MDHWTKCYNALRHCAYWWKFYSSASGDWLAAYYRVLVQQKWLQLYKRLHIFLLVSRFRVTTKIFWEMFLGNILSLPRQEQIVDKMHKNVCGHSNFNDIKTLLQRSKLWNENVQDYLATVPDQYKHCHATKLPSYNRQVSPGTMSSSINDVVLVDLFHLDHLIIFYIMDSVTRYSVGVAVDSVSIVDAIQDFEVHFVGQFLFPNVVREDLAFNNDRFFGYLAGYHGKFSPVPARKHQKNQIESKHRIIRDI